MGLEIEKKRPDEVSGLMDFISFEKLNKQTKKMCAVIWCDLVMLRL